MRISRKKLFQKTIQVVFILCVILFFSIPLVFAQIPEYKPLVGLPRIQLDKGTTIPQYINAVYLLVIVLGALAGVMRIAWAGVKYSLSDVVTDKAAAKKDILGVLLGLAILLTPFIVLKEINPNLVNLDVLRTAKPVNLSELKPAAINLAPAGSVTNADGTISYNVTQSACTARARDAGGTPAFTYTHSGGSVEYGTCVVQALTALTPAQQEARALCLRGTGNTYDTITKRCSLVSHDDENQLEVARLCNTDLKRIYDPVTKRCDPKSADTLYREALDRCGGTKLVVIPNSDGTNTYLCS